MARGSGARGGVAVSQPASTPPSRRRAGAFRPEPSSSPPRLQRGAIASSSQAALHHGRAPPPPPSTQASQRGDGDLLSQGESLSDEEHNKLVAEVMRYMLFKNHQQPNVPVKRDELTQLITRTYKQRNLTSSVISDAQKKFLATFGFEMKEFVRMRSSRAARSSNAGPQVDLKQYVLKSIVPEANLKKYVETTETAAELSLALLVVGIIKFSGGENVPEDTLFQNLRRLGINEEVHHPVFGSMKNAVDVLVKQRYIQKEKLTGNGGEGFVYELAERTVDESFMSRLDDFMAKIVRRDNISAMYSTPV